MLCLTRYMDRLRRLLFISPLALALAACSGPGTTPPPNNVDSNGNSVSSVPWNKPESWETSGQLGGMSGGQ
jgi:outer membrane biogenesis lipoprotein LolB